MNFLPPPPSSTIKHQKPTNPIQDEPLQTNGFKSRLQRPNKLHSFRPKYKQNLSKYAPKVLSKLSIEPPINTYKLQRFLKCLKYASSVHLELEPEFQVM